MVQSWAGRLIYIANGILPARKFTTRVLATLRSLDDGAWTTISPAYVGDVKRFAQFAQTSNGYFLFEVQRPVFQIDCDLSLFGAGGVALPHCYSWTYTAHRFPHDPCSPYRHPPSNNSNLDRQHGV